MADENAKFVGTIPAAYDDCLGPVIFAPYAHDLAARVQACVRKGHLLEVACGTGQLTRRLVAQLSPDVRITATDLNDAMLAHAKAGVPASARLDWRVADASDLPFPSATFDSVACQFGLMFVPDKVVALRETRRVLKPGGTFFFNVWCRIEDNAFARVVHEVVATFFDAQPPTFYQVPFGYHDEAVIQAHLDQVGFVGPPVRPWIGGRQPDRALDPRGRTAHSADHRRGRCCARCARGRCPVSIEGERARVRRTGSVRLCPSMRGRRLAP
jgi:ubiquinone/menaquinone biosynthesis C-methylase UbiE